LWAGVAGQVGAAGQLKADIDMALIPLGWEAENRPFRPHLTVGRVKDSRKVASRQWPENVRPLAIPVKAIHLVESELTPDGPIYTVRHSSPL
jgi:2'-5' RNA ligase